jgi:hypothetical protein
MLTPSKDPKPRRNPLFWAAFGTIGAFLPPYHFRDFLDVLLPASAVVFLWLYFAKSRFAWHVLVADLLVVIPLYAFLSPSWRLHRALNPSIIWFPTIGTFVFAGLLFWSRKRYFSYLEQQQLRIDKSV